MQTENELKLTIELWGTRKQLIEAHAQVMQYQHREADTEIDRAQKTLDELVAGKERNTTEA